MRLAVVPCGGKKLAVKARAGDMYVGSYHQACRRAAEAVEPDHILILSALYGLIPLNQLIEPYDLRMGEPDCWTDGVRIMWQALDLDVLHEAGEVWAFGGRAYTTPVAAAFHPQRTRRPLSGCRGMGEQLARLKQIADGGIAVADAYARGI